MSSKSARVAQILGGLQAGPSDPRYAGFFECFNQQLFFEAHDVLEDLWLKERGAANDLFFKGLIQLAGAFVHLQKSRLSPAAALFRLARGNLARFAPLHESLDVSAVLQLIEQWLGELETGHFAANPLSAWPPPRIELQSAR